MKFAFSCRAVLSINLSNNNLLNSNNITNFWLAPILVEEVFLIIARIKQQSVKMLVAALNVADYAYVLENGRISVHDPAGRLKNDPAVPAAYLGGGAH